MTKIRTTLMIVMAAAGVLLTTASGCDDYVMPGDFNTPTVEPADFSPYGYDYSMYDLFTEDI
ncbi:MAG: hypothetical protein ABII12_15520 [Planctomycetota bacterium]